MTNSVSINDFALRQLKLSFVGTQLTKEQLGAALEVAQAEMALDPWIRVQPIKGDNQKDIGQVVSVHFTRLPQVVANLKCPIAKISTHNAQFLETKYEARREGELPALTRFFPEGILNTDIGRQYLKLLPSHHLDIILYSQEQVQKEFDSNECPHPPTGSDWDLIAVNAELEVSSPMSPSTMLRNALGEEHGGNGTSIDRQVYLASVEFWSKHALVG